MRFKRSCSYVALCQDFINLVGHESIRTDCQVSAQHVVQWRKTGFTRPWALYLSLKYPEQWEEIFKCRVFEYNKLSVVSTKEHK